MAVVVHISVLFVVERKPLPSRHKTTAAVWMDRRGSDRLTEVEHTMSTPEAEEMPAVLAGRQRRSSAT